MRSTHPARTIEQQRGKSSGLNGGREDRGRRLLYRRVRMGAGVPVLERGFQCKYHVRDATVL